MNTLLPPVLRRVASPLLLATLILPHFAAGQTPNYQGPVYQQQPSGKYQALAEKVAQISANDQRQDTRLNHLEHDVNQLNAATPNPSLEGGTSPAPALIPYTPYQVRKNDTLWRIAMNHRVSPGDIMGFNRMPNDTVVEGQVLMIPQKSGGAKAGPSTTVFHTVKPNESFGSISRKYGITTDALAKANPKINPNKLQAGAKLALPAGARIATPRPMPSVAWDNGLPAPTLTTHKEGTHIVQAGESLSVIAQKHHVKLAALQKANNITNANAVRVGQKLVIPAAGTAAAQAPAPSKSPSSKAKSTGSAPPPAGSGVANAPEYPTPPTKPTPPTPPEKPQNNRGVVAYRMEKGDTVDTVAQLFGTTGAEIRRLNKLTTSSRLNEGDEILVPAMGPVAGN